MIKRIRQGVATRYIASLIPGQEITVTLSKGGLGVDRKEVERPVVMIGPGTGVAPMRSLIYQRMQWRQELGITSNGENGGAVKDLLFFGCRNADADYFFKEEWEELMASGTPLGVFTAFSRDQVSPFLLLALQSFFVLTTVRQRQKVYVQDIIREQAVLIYASLAMHSGIVYICGSSGRMPQAVREALTEVFQGQGAMERQDAENYLVAMEKSGRYRQETW